MKWSLIATILPHHPLWLGEKTCPKCNTKTNRCSLFPSALESLLSFTNSSNWLLDWPSWSHWFLSYNIHICYLPAGRSLWWKTVTVRSWKCCPRPTASGSILKTEVRVLRHTDRPLAGKEHIYFFVKLNEILSERTRMIKGC